MYSMICIMFLSDSSIVKMIPSQQELGAVGGRRIGAYISQDMRHSRSLAAAPRTPGRVKEWADLLMPPAGECCEETRIAKS
jgi:hypothetical protein